MEKTENPKRVRARLIYLRSGCKKSLQKISDELGVPLATVKTWKRRDKWDEDEKAQKKPAGGPPAGRKAGGQPGNQNALYASREGNGNATATGEYSRIYPGEMTDEEKALAASFPDDLRDQLKGELILLTIRERRMMERINALQGREDRDGLLLDYSSSTTNTTGAGGERVTSTSETVSRTPAIDRILRIEEALTRVQAQKTKVLCALNECGEDEDGGGDLIIFYDYGDRDTGNEAEE